MPNSFTALYTHFIFSTKGRQALLTASIRPELFAYIGGICRNEQCTLIDAGGVEDHVHLLVRRHATVAESNILRDIKANSSRWIKKHVPDFAWQDGGGMFSAGPQSLEQVRSYLAGQEEHHRHKSFREEFIEFLDKYGIEYDPKYLDE